MITERPTVQQIFTKQNALSFKTLALHNITLFFSKTALSEKCSNDMEYHNYIYLTALKFKISKTLYVFFSKFKYFRSVIACLSRAEFVKPTFRIWHIAPKFAPHHRVKEENKNNYKRYWWRVNMIITIHLHFTQFNVSVRRIPSRIWKLCSIVEVDDVSAMTGTGDVCRIRYCSFGVIGILKAEYSVLFVGCVGYEDWESKESWCISVVVVCRL